MEKRFKQLKEASRLISLLVYELQDLKGYQEISFDLQVVEDKINCDLGAAKLAKEREEMTVATYGLDQESPLSEAVLKRYVCKVCGKDFGSEFFPDKCLCCGSIFNF